MGYRRLGRSGLKVSELSYGTMTFGNPLDPASARELLAAAKDHGINFFDSAQDQGLGLTTWGPLSAGLLSGKYREGIPEDSRASRSTFGRLKERIADTAKREAIQRLTAVADELQVSLAQLSLAWLLLSPHVSAVITGATKTEQLKSNLGALEVLPKLTPDVVALIDQAIAGNNDLLSPPPAFP